MKCKNQSCNQEFIPNKSIQKYCSEKCRNIEGVRRWRLKTMKRCKCGSVILEESKKCVKCYYIDHSVIHKNLTLFEYQNLPSVKNKHSSWKNSHIRILCKSWNKHLQNIPCQKCNYDKHTEFCHIKPISSFDKNSKIGDINDESNILILCRNCHWEFDNNILNINDIPKRQALPHRFEL